MSIYKHYMEGNYILNGEIGWKGFLFCPQIFHSFLKLHKWRQKRHPKAASSKKERRKGERKKGREGKGFSWPERAKELKFAKLWMNENLINFHN